MNPAQYDDLGPMQRDILGELRRRYDADTAEAALAALREEIAHELAEKIRAEAARAETLSGSMQGRRIRIARLREAADLIDPESGE